MIPKYITVKEKINQDILDNKYEIGTNLPTEMELANIYQVSRSTIRQALLLLTEQGIISKHWGSGNKVIGKSDSSKKNTVMILLPSTTSPEAKVFLSDIYSVLLKNKFETEIYDSKNSFQAEREVLKLLLKDIYGGLIIYPANSNLPSPNADLFQLLLKRQTPVVFVNSAPSELYNPLVVTLDYYGKGYQMARSLINMGHQKLGGIFINNNSDSVKCFQGFVEAIRDANLPILDNCFLWCYQNDPVGISSRTPATINRFLKKAYEEASAVYVDDPSLTSEGLFPLFSCSLSPAKSQGKECGLAFLALKKNGNSTSVTIPFKN